MKNHIWYLSVKSEDETEIIFEYYTNDIDYALFRAQELKHTHPQASWEIEDVSYIDEEIQKEIEENKKIE